MHYNTIKIHFQDKGYKRTTVLNNPIFNNISQYGYLLFFIQIHIFINIEMRYIYHNLLLLMIMIFTFNIDKVVVNYEIKLPLFK